MFLFLKKNSNSDGQKGKKVPDELPKEWECKFPISNHYKPKVLCTCNYELNKKLNEILSPNVKALFRSIQSNAKEFQANICGHCVRLSVKEFVLITGLDCMGDCNKSEFVQKSIHIIDSCFCGVKLITQKSVEDVVLGCMLRDDDALALKVPDSFPYEVVEKIDDNISKEEEDGIVSCTPLVDNRKCSSKLKSSFVDFGSSDLKTSPMEFLSSGSLYARDEQDFKIVTYVKGLHALDDSFFDPVFSELEAKFDE
uniref:Uncharacterized protein n=1 Tax=Cannabis sativa TaxID=3483 RepID=A0A803QCH1_CANSA